MVRCSIATIVSPLFSNRDRTSPTSPRRTASGLIRTRVRAMRETLTAQLAGPSSDVVGHRRPGERVLLELAAARTQREHARPDSRFDVLGLVADTLGAQLQRRLAE